MTMLARLIGVVVGLLATCAHAQYAPAGNAHPDTELVSAEDTERAHPFGTPTHSALRTLEAKAAFAESVDLAPLEGLAVFHNGRVKILDSLARETVDRVAGRHEIVIAEGETTARFDPMFTLLDLSIDPAFYADRPLIGVSYLPLRREMLEMAFGPAAEEVGSEAHTLRERWLRSGRVSPRMVDALATPIFDRHLGEPAFRGAIADMERARDMALFSVANWLVVAPGEPDLPWAHIGDLESDQPARLASQRLGDAWRAGDASAANAAIAELAQILPTINPETYPQGRRTLELAYNRSNSFEWGYWAYFLSFLALVLAFGTGRNWLAGVGITLFSVALVLHGFGFITRCLIAERFAIQNQFESMAGLSLFATLTGLVMMLRSRKWLYGAAAAGAGFLILITATETGIPGRAIEREAAILNTSVLLKYHVTTVLTSYGLITLGMIVSLFYLGVHYGSKLFGRSEAHVLAEGALSTMDTPAPVNSANPDSVGKAGGANTKRTLKELDTAQMTILQLAFWTLGVGVLLGAWWADHSWGRWWAFDPKETWALVTWIVYLIVIHVRFTGLKDRGLTTAWLSVIGFIVMLWTYFGVNLLLPGLHAYA
ncbi:MAG: cytochrome c biogenesis protein CcsA [Planctomycetota bacterium]